MMFWFGGIELEEPIRRNLFVNLILIVDSRLMKFGTWCGMAWLLPRWRCSFGRFSRSAWR